MKTKKCVKELDGFNINISLLITILEMNSARNLVCIDFSKVSHAPGNIGITSVIIDNILNYVVYEVDEYGISQDILVTPDENLACIEVLKCVGISLV